MMQKNKLKQEEREWPYRSIFEAANDGLILTDLEEGFVVEENPAACLMHGYTREEFVGLPLTGFMHTDSQPALSEYSQVEINLTQIKAMIELSIRDDGRGFDPTQTFSGHYGLKMMRERAEAVGANLSVTSRPGHGTELIARWAKPSSDEVV